MLKAAYVRKLGVNATPPAVEGDAGKGKALGSDHMVMGSDFPHLLGSIGKVVSSIEALNIQHAEQRRIFEGTALSILNNV